MTICEIYKMNPVFKDCIKYAIQGMKKSNEERVRMWLDAFEGAVEMWNYMNPNHRIGYSKTHKIHKLIWHNFYSRYNR